MTALTQAYASYLHANGTITSDQLKELRAAPKHTTGAHDLRSISYASDQRALAEKFKAARAARLAAAQAQRSLADIVTGEGVSTSPPTVTQIFSQSPAPELVSSGKLAPGEIATLALDHPIKSRDEARYSLVVEEHDDFLATTLVPSASGNLAAEDVVEMDRNEGDSIDEGGLCWTKIFRASALINVGHLADGPLSVGELLTFARAHEELWSKRTDFCLRKVRPAQYHISYDGTCSVATIVDGLTRLPSSAMVGANRGKTGWQRYLEREREEQLEADGRTGHYRDLQQKLLAARTQPWYGRQQIQDLLSALEGKNYSYVQQRQEALVLLGQLAPYGVPLYGWRDRFPGHDEYFVASAFGAWQKNFTQLRTALMYREQENKLQEGPRAPGGRERASDTDMTDSQKSMLLYLNTLRDMHDAISSGDGVYDRGSFESHFDLHWIPDDDDGGHGPDRPDDGDPGKGKRVPRKRTRRGGSVMSVEEAGPS
jgi:hypothetical protein